MDKLKKSIDDALPQVEAEINQAVRDAAAAAYATIVSKAQNELGGSRKDYLKGLQFTDLGDNGFLISLEGSWANQLEDGYPSYIMQEALLKSDKMVQVGSRAGQPWVQDSKPKGKNKESHKFAHVPFEHKPYSKEAGNSDVAGLIKTMLGRGVNGELKAMTKVFGDRDGNPMEGKVAVAHPDSVKNPLLEGLVKYQKVYKNDAGKTTVQSIYMTYRTISQVGKPWVHPGFEGLHAFADAEKELIKQIDQILKVLI